VAEGCQTGLQAEACHQPVLEMLREKHGICI